MLRTTYYCLLLYGRIVPYRVELGDLGALSPRFFYSQFSTVCSITMHTSIFCILVHTILSAKFDIQYEKLPTPGTEIKN